MWCAHLRNSAWENLFGLMRPPLHEGAIMNTNSSLRHCLILALNSDAGDLDSASAGWACRALGPKPNPSLCFQNSVLTLLDHRPSCLGIQGPQRSTLHAHHKKIIPYGVAQNPPMRINLLGPQQYPNSIGYSKHKCYAYTA